MDYRTHKGGDWFIPVIHHDHAKYCENIKKLKLLLAVLEAEVNGSQCVANKTTFKVKMEEKLTNDVMQNVLLKMSLLIVD